MTQQMFSSARKLQLDQLDEKLSKLDLKRHDVPGDSFYLSVVRQLHTTDKHIPAHKLHSNCAKFLRKNDVIGQDETLSWRAAIQAPDEQDEYLRRVGNLDKEYVDSNVIQVAANLLKSTITVINLDKEDLTYNSSQPGKKKYCINLARLDDSHFYSAEKNESQSFVSPGPSTPAIKDPVVAGEPEQSRKVTIKEPALSRPAPVANSSGDPASICKDKKTPAKETDQKRKSTAAERSAELQTDLGDAAESKWAEIFPTEVEEEMKNGDGFALSFAIKVAKYISTLAFFCAVLLGGITTKATFLVLGNAYSQDYSTSTCPTITEGKINAPFFARYMVMLILMTCLCFPELVAFLYSLWIIVKTREPQIRWSSCLTGMIPEVLHAVGLTFLTLKVIPNIDATLASPMFSLVALNPSIRQALATYTIFAFYRDKDQHEQSDAESMRSSQYDEEFSRLNKAQKRRDLILSVIATPLLVAGYGLLGWQIFDTADGDKTNITICALLSLVLMSTRYWENFMLPRKPQLDENGKEIREFNLQTLQRDIEEMRFKTSIIYSIVRLCVIVSCCFLIHFVIDKNQAVVEYRSAHAVYFKDARISSKCSMIVTSFWFAGLTNCLCSLGTFIFGFIACQASVQRWSFVLPLAVLTPTMSSLTASYTVIGTRSGKTLMDFFNLPMRYSFANEFISWKTTYQSVEPDIMAVVVIIGVVTGCLGLVLATSYSWEENKTAIPRVEALFVKPIYSGPLISEVMLLNRRQYSLTAKKWYDKQRREFVPQVFLCTTMWHETEQELTKILTSIMRLDWFHSEKMAKRLKKDKYDPDFFNFEVHVLFDDAIVKEGTKKPRINDYVKQLLNLIPIAANTVKSKAGEKIAINVLYETPYGGRIEILLPNNNWMYIHLKDKTRIRKKKRWSQCMYMCYILRYLREVKKQKYRPKDVFILALDGDVDFEPPALVYLLDIMKKDPDVGAACGRIHPTGSGPVVWFQKFEYAVGHWLQKTAEDVLGCVLCSPGCFSLFRGEALMKKNVVGTYMKQASEPSHKIQWDQGEDRWLCTLLLKQGMKIEYCAASDSYTFAPEEFKEFYDQRRRWGPSTLANVLDILLDASVAVRKNKNISWGYIAYQMGLMASSLLGPSTVVLVVQGSLQYVFGMSAIGALLAALIPVIIFIIICYTTKPAFQILIASILTIVYALVMMAVLVGIIGQMSESLLNPSSIFMLFMIALYTFTGLIHPTEMLCLLHGLLYYLCVPSAFIFLPIYSYCNMNNVSWGTREDPKPTTPRNPQQIAGKSGEKMSLAIERKQGAENYGCGWGNMCRCLVCINPQEYQPLPTEEPKTEAQKPLPAKSKLPRKRWEMLQKRYSFAKNFFMGEKGEKPIETNLSQKQKEKQTGEVYFEVEGTLPTLNICDLDEEETRFWSDIIAFFLKPVDENDKTEKEKEKKMKKALERLKNKMSGAYLFINSLWLILTFSLTMVIQDVNITLYDRYGNETVLNPLAFLFLIFFLVILVIQFITMMFHRWNTFIHLMAKTGFFKEKQKKSDPADRPASTNRRTGATTTDVPSTSTSENQPARGGVVNESYKVIDEEEEETSGASGTRIHPGASTYGRRPTKAGDIALQAFASGKIFPSTSSGAFQDNGPDVTFHQAGISTSGGIGNRNETTV